MNKLQNNRSELTYDSFAKLLPVFAIGVVAVTFAVGFLLHGCKMPQPHKKVVTEQVIIIYR